MTVYRQRLDRLKSIMQDKGYNAFYIANITNVRYLSGFTGSSGFLLITDEGDYFFSDGRYTEQSKHEITVGNYTTKFFHMCGSAQTTMKKHASKDGAEELAKMQDMFYKMEKDAMDAGSANDEQKKKSQILYDKIMAKAKEVGIADEVGKYMKMHLDSMLKGSPKLGFGRTDVKESYQEMIARIMSQRSMR